MNSLDEPKKHCYVCKNLKWICEVEENNIRYDVWDCPSDENRYKNMGADCNHFIKSIHITKRIKNDLGIDNE